MLYFRIIKMQISLQTYHLVDKITICIGDMSMKKGRDLEEEKQQIKRIILLS